MDSLASRSVGSLGRDKHVLRHKICGELSAKSDSSLLSHDAEAYIWRHLVENCYNKLKRLMSVHARYDKTDISHQATIRIATKLIPVR